jgi:hypothetical protein
LHFDALVEVLFFYEEKVLVERELARGFGASRLDWIGLDWWMEVRWRCFSYLFEFGLGLRHICGLVRMEVLCGCAADRLRVCVVGYRAGVVCLTVRLVGYWLPQCEVQVEGLMKRLAFRDHMTRLPPFNSIRFSFPLITSTSTCTFHLFRLRKLAMRIAYHMG